MFRSWLLLLIPGALAMVPCRAVAQFSAPPIPDPNFAGIILDQIQDDWVIDDAAKTFRLDAPILGVHLPGNIISTDDFLVTHGATFDVTGSFTGDGFSDPKGRMLDVSESINVGGQALYTAFSPEHKFAGFETVQGVEFRFFRGVVQSVTLDPVGVQESRLLKVWADLPITPGVSEMSWGGVHVTGCVFNHVHHGYPEPPSMVLLIIGAGLAAGSAWRRPRILHPPGPPVAAGE